MAAKLDRERVQALVEPHWKRLYNFVFRLTLDRERAERYLLDIYKIAIEQADKAPADVNELEVWLLGVANTMLEQRLPRQPEVNFDILDETLRSEATRTDVVRSLSDPDRDFLLWELKQGCMTSVINCLSPGERSAFVLANIMKLGDDEASKVLGITKSAYKVRLSRAQKKVTDYLAPRCEHVDPRNPCHCPSRLGVAMSRGFLPPPPNALAQIRQPYGRFGSSIDGEDAPLRDVMAIYQSLPDPDPPDDLAKELLAKLDSAEWAEVKKKGKH